MSNRRPTFLYKSDNRKVYVMATRSSNWLGRLIRFFSGIRSKAPEEFDHVVIAYRGTEYQTAWPKAKKQKIRLRDDNVIYEVKTRSKDFWPFIGYVVGSRQRYGTWQVLTKSFTMLFGWNPIKAGMDCIEFVIRALVGNKNVQSDIDRLTVGEGIEQLVKAGKIVEVARYTKGEEYRTDEPFFKKLFV